MIKNAQKDTQQEKNPLKLVLAYFYSELLNLYGDNGNVEILLSRAKAKGIDVELLKISVNDDLDEALMSKINLIFMGGGPDSSQEAVYKDLVFKKGPLIKNYILNGGVGLYICGSYQLLGNYYKAADGTEIKGLGAVDFYTQHPGDQKKRCIGNTVCRLGDELLEDPIFKALPDFSKNIVGFENHGGRTFLAPTTKTKEDFLASSDLFPLATVIKGCGNNSEDKTEGVHFKNTLGSYFHGPLLSRNPHIADYLIAKALKLDAKSVSKLKVLDDSLLLSAHEMSKNLR